MGEPENVTKLPEPLPAEITITQMDLRLKPNEMRALKEATGRTLDEVMGAEADDADRMQAIVWLELRRLGHAPTWDAAGDVAVKFEADLPDPTNPKRSMSSQDSADSGE